ncbi:thioredoxin-like domain-containing protein [Marinoscillum sp.]|uniref:thioredoxin-like domain-containing protein n=1 Tax=Marinoscillum sp. TaxID=2024838 RepID=UPI003BABF116
MRNIVLMILWIAPYLSLSQSAEINFKIKDFKDSIAYIGYHFGHQKYLMDTLPVIDDRFSMKVDQPKQGIYFIYTPSYYFEFVMDGKSFGLETSVSGGYDQLKVSGSKENDLFRSFQVEIGGLQNKQRSMMEGLREANGEDSVQIMKAIREVNVQMEDVRKKLISENSQSFVAAFLRLMRDPEVPPLDSIQDESQRKIQRYAYYKNHFFEDGQLEDGRLLRTPLFYPKVTKYFDEVVIQQPDSLINALDWFFDQIREDEESFRYWLVTLFKRYAESKVMGMDAVMVHMIESFYLSGQATWISEEYEKTLREEVAYVKPNLIGKVAPPINAVDTLMQAFAFSDIQTRYTLLFIYDPDCGHCKKSVKKLEEVDSRMAELDITVVALCTTTDVSRWKKFVDSHNPMWVHLIDPTGKSYFRVSYDVRSTPRIYLLDANKRILAKRLEIDQFLDVVERAHGGL